MTTRILLTSYPLSTKPLFRNADSFNDAIDASRGMLAMAQGNQANTDVTPRALYGSRNNSINSYGFPETYSTHSSVSSASGYPYYNHSHNPSIDGSVAGSSITDYNSESEHFANRILPVPGQMMPNPQYPPEGAQAQMMTQFNSKVGSATQKKHKCKICDKRFTRPSSLQTHMYSHTGEKRKSLIFIMDNHHAEIVFSLPV